MIFVCGRIYHLPCLHLVSIYHASSRLLQALRQQASLSQFQWALNKYFWLISSFFLQRVDKDWEAKFAIVKDEMQYRKIIHSTVICLHVATERLIVGYTNLLTGFMCVTHPVYYTTQVSKFESILWGITIHKNSCFFTNNTVIVLAGEG